MRLASLYSPVMSDYISPALLPITLQVDWWWVVMVVVMVDDGGVGLVVDDDGGIGLVVDDDGGVGGWW